MTFLHKIKTKVKISNSKIIIGLEYFIKAHQFVWKNQLGRHLLISGFIFLLFFSGTIKLLIYSINSFEPQVTTFLISILKDYLNFSVEELKIGIKAIFWLIRNAVESNKDSIFISIFLVVGTPYFSFISRKVENIIHNRSANLNSGNLWKEIIRGLKISIKNSFKQFFLIVLITLFSFIPFLGILSPLLIFIVQTYYNGILMSDYSLEQQGYSVKESRAFYSENKAKLFSIGLGFMFLLLIPVVGWFFAPTYSLVASSLFFSQKRSENKV